MPVIFEKLREIVRGFSIQFIAIPPFYLLNSLNSNLDPTPGHGCAGFKEIPNFLGNNARITLKLWGKKLTLERT